MKERTHKKIRAAMIALLCASAALAVSLAFGRVSVSFAQTAEPVVAPLMYEYVAPASGSAEGSYKVTGVDLAQMKEGAAFKPEWTQEKRENLKIVIPATYNDGSHGVLPVTEIGLVAFSKSSGNNPDVNFVSLDLRGATNLTSIGGQAFSSSNISGELFLPASLKEPGVYAFSDTKISSIVFADGIGSLSSVGFSFLNVTLNNQQIRLPAGLRFSMVSRNLFAAVNGIESFAVDENNGVFSAIDGVLYARDGNEKYLVAYPSARAGETYRLAEGTTQLAARAFYSLSNDNLKLVMLPEETVALNSYSFRDTAINLFFERTSGVDINVNAEAFQDFRGKVILPSEQTRSAALGEGGFLNGVNGISDSNVTYLSSLSARLKADADVGVTTTAQQLKEMLEVSAKTPGDGASALTVPISGYLDFNVSLPAGGLAYGSNDVTVSYGTLSQTLSVTIKSTPAAPSAPVVSGTPTSGTITLTAIEGAEYSIDGGATWQDSPAFTGLEANTEYTFVARVKETATAHASVASESVSIRTDKLTPAVPPAPVVSGTPTSGSITLTAIEGAEYSIDGGVTWQDSPAFTGLEANTEYTFVARVKETATAHASAASESVSIATDKLTPAAPPAPVVSGTPTSGSITLTAIEGAEYSIDGGATWQDSPAFTGLAADTEYTVLARIKGTADAYASEISIAATIKTAPLPAQGLSGGAIAGIVIGCILFVVLLYGLGFFFLYQKGKLNGKVWDCLYLPMKKFFGDTPKERNE